MISFTYKTDFSDLAEESIALWLTKIIEEEDCEVGDMEFIFCSDTYLHELNVTYLEHDTLTDIITFDHRVGDLIMGEIFLSVDRVLDNAKTYDVSFIDELHRVMAHGVLHILGYNDLTEAEAKAMRTKEDWALSLRDF